MGSLILMHSEQKPVFIGYMDWDSVGIAERMVRVPGL